MKFVDPLGEEVISDNLTPEQKKELIEDLKRKTGYQNIYFDANNKLVIDTAAGFNGGSALARSQLSDAVNSSIRFNLYAVDSTDVAFAEVDRGMTSKDASGETLLSYNVKIDFADYGRVNGDKEAIAAYTVGINLIHEFDHKLYDEKDEPNSDTNPGPLENKYINPIRRELGLAERTYYTAKIIPAAFQQFYENQGRELSFKLNGKTKLFRWRHDQVGGKEVKKK